METKKNKKELITEDGALIQSCVSVSALSGKAKVDFKKWFSNYSEKYHHLKGWRDYDQYLDEVEFPETILNALIIEWFDSLGLLIGTYPNLYGKFVWHLNKSDTYKRWPNDISYTSRIEATNKCIEKVNELYNDNVV